MFSRPMGKPKTEYLQLSQRDGCGGCINRVQLLGPPDLSAILGQLDLEDSCTKGTRCVGTGAASLA
jgi:hypothetical protein